MKLVREEPDPGRWTAVSYAQGRRLASAGAPLLAWASPKGTQCYLPRAFEEVFETWTKLLGPNADPDLLFRSDSHFVDQFNLQMATIAEYAVKDLEVWPERLDAVVTSYRIGGLSAVRELLGLDPTSSAWLAFGP